MLNAQLSINQAQETPIPYTNAVVDGSRITFTVSREPDDHIVGQPWYVQPSEDGRAVEGEIDDISDDIVVLWTNLPPKSQIPRKGTLHYDTRASRQALRRQRLALDDIRFERCVRPGLKDILANPSLSQPPDAISPENLFQSDMDEIKRHAVGMALATRDFLFVEGPPGTGKTRFIAEAILQSAGPELFPAYSLDVSDPRRT